MNQQRLITEYPLPGNFLDALVHLSTAFPSAMVLNSNSGHHAPDPYGDYDFLAGLGSASELRGGNRCFEDLQEFLDRSGDWIFGSFSYDLKNQVEDLASGNPDGMEFPSCHFFQPQHVLAVPKGERRLLVYSLPGQEPETVADALKRPSPPAKEKNIPPIRARFERDEYIRQVERIRQHIQQGDIYEMNFCMEFFSEGAAFSPAQTWLDLNAQSPMPFSCFYKMDDRYLLCASPERFLKKSGQKIISQPIKGTARRGKDENEDAEMRNRLLQEEKERAENVMIVDLVRNDLSRTALRGSVRVEELMGIYTFPALHQMISTVVSETAPGKPVTEIIRAAFPMGSMTGAPKVRAMQLIEEMERSRRGLFSGSVGYFTPGGDFDLNVVIRSILYRENTYLSFQAGSAITISSDAASEYEECLLKARSMWNALTHD